MTDSSRCLWLLQITWVALESFEICYKSLFSFSLNNDVKLTLRNHSPWIDDPQLTTTLDITSQTYKKFRAEKSHFDRRSSSYPTTSSIPKSGRKNGLRTSSNLNARMWTTSSSTLGCFKSFSQRRRGPPSNICSILSIKSHPISKSYSKMPLANQKIRKIVQTHKIGLKFKLETLDN